VNINIDTFNDWAVKGKDVDMQKGHVNAVDQMLDLIDNKTKVLKRPFKFLDIGCGNGWVVRKVSKF
jgi:2-polyprenyl-3-methyl-5-hydroxy-6-metoxy-1,4-benzoquinol methylase